MKNLIEVSRIISKKKIRKIEIFDSTVLDSKSSKFTEFYDGLMTDRFKNDRDAASLLYKSSPSDDKYRQLKSRFRKRLLNTLFFLDQNQPDSGGYDRATFTANRDWALVNILTANKAHVSAEEMARQVLQVALKYRLATLVVNSARILRDFAAEEGNEAEFEAMDATLREFLGIEAAEIKSEELLQRVHMVYSKPLNEMPPNHSELLQGYCDALVSLSELHDSATVYYNMYLVWAYHYELQRNYAEMLLICEQAEQYIDRHPNFLPEEKLAEFHIKKMSGYLHLRDFKNGKVNAERSMKLFEEGSDLWFIFMEYYLLMALHTDNFIHAGAVFLRTKGNSKFKRQEPDLRERWKVYEIYLNYFLAKQPGDLEALQTQVAKSFRLQRFLNEPVIFPRELRPLTIHAVVGQLLFFLDKGALPEAAETIGRLRTFGKTLEQAENFRMLQFIRLMGQVLKADFKLSQISKKDDNYEALVKHPFVFRNHLAELEIVPYERLWNHVLTLL